MTRIWVTRDEPPDGPLASALLAAGLTPLSEPVLETIVVADARSEIAALGPEDWLVLTSVRAIEAVAQPEATLPRVAVVGEVSAAAARELGLRVEFISPSGEAADVWRHLQRHAAGCKVCFPRSSRSAVPALEGAEVSAPIVYEVRDRPFDVSVARSADVACFASPSAVRSAAHRLGKLALPAASIGPTTSAAIREYGGALLVESPQRCFKSLAQAIAAAADA